MKLHSPVFERALMKGVKQAVRADPQLRKEARRVRHRRRLLHPGVIRMFLSLILADVVWGVYHQTRHVDSALAAIGLWLLLSTLLKAQALQQLPYRSRDIMALTLLPVEESTVFDWELDKFLKQSLLLLWDIAVGLAALGFSLGLPLLPFLALAVMAVLTWAVVLALAMLGATRFPRLPYGMLAGGLYIAGFVAFVAHNLIGREYLHMADRAAPFFNWVMPFGWPLSLVHLVVGDGSWHLGFLLLPTATLIWLAWESLPVLASRFQYHEWLQAEAADVVPGEQAGDLAAGVETDRPSIGATAIEEGILSGQFLAREEWNGGWIETKLWRWFSPREKTLAEFAFPNGFFIFKPWKSIFRIFIIAFLLGLGAGLAGLRMLEVSIISIGLVIVFVRALAQVLATGAAFRVVRIGGVAIPFYAAFPVSYRDLSAVLCKCSLIQMPLVALLTTPTLVAAMISMGQSFERGFLMGIKACIVLFGGRLLMLVLAFSSSTADTSSFRLRTLVQIVFFIAFGVAYIGLAGAGIFLPFETASWLCCGAALFIGYASYRAYGWSYNANRFDLMRPVQ